ncbi:MAG TPA: GNAT family protein [Segetibacter sp.]|jgi:RimJ/RimL family protein N-acetyltransferase
MPQVIDFEKEYFLENDRALLRPLLQSDFNNLLNFSIEEPELWKFSLVTAIGADALHTYLQQAESNRKAEKEYPFIIFDKEKNKYAGTTRFYDILPDFQTVQLGYTWYGSAFQGTGLNRNCKFLLLQLAFETWQMERVELRADNDNVKSIAAMKSIGCKVDGVLRSNMPKRDGGRRDSIVLSILKSEWENDVKQSLQKKLSK